MKAPAKRQLHIADSVEEALGTFERFGSDAEYFAGGTWIMRADLREESGDRHYICLSRLAELAGIVVSSGEVSIGASETHARIAETLAPISEYAALVSAAGKSANPAIRNMATIGGNICTVNFAAADLVPSLLCLSASVEVVSTGGKRKVGLEDFLRMRRDFSGIVTRVLVPRANRRSASVRLPLKKAGDYPAAIVSASAALLSDGTIENPIIAVGCVEAHAKRWTGLEAAIKGKALGPEAVSDIAKHTLAEFTGRDGIEAPGWYRIRVLPELVRRAFIEMFSYHSGR